MKWVYHIDDWPLYDMENIARILDGLGAKGWELVTAFVVRDKMRVILKIAEK